MIFLDDDGAVLVRYNQKSFQIDQNTFNKLLKNFKNLFNKIFYWLAN